MKKNSLLLQTVIVLAVILAIVPKISVASDPIKGSSVNFLAKDLFKKFDRAFPNSSDASWTRDGKTTRFFFHQNGAIVRVAMKDNGEILHVIRYYESNMLPSEVRNAIKSQYKGYKISRVTEVNVLDKTAYIVKLEGIEDWLMVKYLEGEITEQDHFTNKEN